MNLYGMGVGAECEVVDAGGFHRRAAGVFLVRGIQGRHLSFDYDRNGVPA
jgi:hypothetical protein